jgi:hypothetical protein
VKPIKVVAHFIKVVDEIENPHIVLDLLNRIGVISVAIVCIMVIKYTRQAFIMAFMILALILPSTRSYAQDEKPMDHGWPRVFQASDGTMNTVFQPQLDSWDGFTLKTYAAFAVRKPGEQQSLYGVAYLTAHTIVDKNDRMVYFNDLTITNVQFPSAPERESSILAELRQAWPPQMKNVSLDRLEASLAITKELKKVKTQPLNNHPPRIIFSQRPSVLAYIDGAPRYVPVKGSSLMRIINTRVLILRDKAGKYYFHLFNGFMEAQSLNGPWTIARALPKDISVAMNEARRLQQVDLLEGQADPQTNKYPTLEEVQPLVFISTTPAELIVTDGLPNYVPIQGTKLLYVENTSAHVFKYLGDQKTYVLLSGRWFRAVSLNGPWEYVSGKHMPADFARIPDESPQENVKASIPGTNQAEEALIANSIPQTAKIDRKGAAFIPQIDGMAQISPIEGTSLFYVVNSPTPIIKVNERSWYACEDGVWFFANSLGGPWVVADYVPPVIYSIPPSSPIHFVTYVRIYNADPDDVYCGYTPGYYGCMVSPDYVVVYGTGYDYPPWIGSDWYGPPVTYCNGADICWTPWGGWNYCFGFGWFWDSGPYWYYPPSPWWGPYWGWRHHPHPRVRPWGPHGWASTSSNVYRLWGKDARVIRPATEYQPITGSGSSMRYGMAYNSTTGTLITGHRNAEKNVYIIENSSGTTVTLNAPSRGKGEKSIEGALSEGKFQSAQIIIYPWRKPTETERNNAYATPEGNVYIHQSQTGAWQRITAPRAIQGQEPGRVMPQLEQERSARSIGQQRAETFQAHHLSEGSSSKENSGGHSRTFREHHQSEGSSSKENSGSSRNSYSNSYRK